MGCWNTPAWVEQQFAGCPAEGEWVYTPPKGAPAPGEALLRCSRHPESTWVWRERDTEAYLAAMRSQAKR